MYVHYMCARGRVRMATCVAYCAATHASFPNKLLLLCTFRPQKRTASTYEDEIGGGETMAAATAKLCEARRNFTEISKVTRVRFRLSRIGGLNVSRSGACEDSVWLLCVQSSVHTDGIILHDKENRKNAKCKMYKNLYAQTKIHQNSQGIKYTISIINSGK